MDGSSTQKDAAGRGPVIPRIVLVVAVAAGSALLTVALGNRAALRAETTRADAAGNPHFLRFGKTYVNMTAVSHVISDPGFGLPADTLQVYFRGQSYANLYGEDAEALRRVLEGAGGAAPTPKAAEPVATGSSGTAPVSVRKPPAKKSVPRVEPR